MCDGVSLLSCRSRSRGRAQADDEDSMDATLPPEMGEGRKYSCLFSSTNLSQSRVVCLLSLREKRVPWYVRQTLKNSSSSISLPLCWRNGGFFSAAFRLMAVSVSGCRRGDEEWLILSKSFKHSPAFLLATLQSRTSLRSQTYTYDMSENVPALRKSPSGFQHKNTYTSCHVLNSYSDLPRNNLVRSREDKIQKNKTQVLIGDLPKKQKSSQFQSGLHKCLHINRLFFLLRIEFYSISIIQLFSINPVWIVELDSGKWSLQ